MTLVLTDVSRFGVAMAADSAITLRTGRVYLGAQKLLPVYQIDAGLAVWGRGTVNGGAADEWLQLFIENEVTDGMRLWEVATTLAESLNRAFGGVISERMGVHLGGFDEQSGTRGAAFYHVHNGHYHVEVQGGQIIEVPDEQPPLREFRAHEDVSPVASSQGQYRLTGNGDFAIFMHLFQSLGPIFKGIRDVVGLQFPFPPTLASRGEYLRFWISTIKEIYRQSNFRRRILPEPATAGDASIGGPVTVLTISDAGIQSFYTR